MRRAAATSRRSPRYPRCRRGAATHKPSADHASVVVVSVVRPQWPSCFVVEGVGGGGERRARELGHGGGEVRDLDGGRRVALEHEGAGGARGDDHAAAGG